MLEEKENELPTKFKEIKTVDGLKMYLDDKNKRTKNSPFLYHYTTFSNFVKIIQGRTWHLGNASGMNDRLEYDNGDLNRWQNLFFSCFMCEDKESIGMWSMYAQPWENGVKIALPREYVLEWVKNVEEIQEISTKDYKPNGNKIHIGKGGASLRLSSVAYCNTDSLQKIGAEEKVKWSNQTNTNFKNIAKIPELTGYIKDMAWSYEKEIRIKVELDYNTHIERVAIPIPEEVISNMIITASPLFKGDFEEKIKQEIPYSIKIERSIFTGKLNIKTICQECKYKFRKKS